MKLGIYGGTFSPIHNGHVMVAKAFLETLKLDKLLVIPAGQPPHKQVSANVDPQRRLEMCRLAFEGSDKIEISDIELRRKGKSYTVMTLRELKNDETELYFLCGTDMLLTFDKWYCFEEIFKLCTLVCARRERDYDVNCRLESKIAELTSKYSAKILVLNTDILEMSSTDIRDKMSRGESVYGMLPPKVYDYINSNELYRLKE